MTEPGADDATPSPFGSASRERFVLSRRYAAGTGGVRGLLITVLGDYVRPTRHAAPTSAFIDVLSRLGVAEAACRQSLVRAAADGWLTSHRDGRYTWWRLSPAFARFLDIGAGRILGFTGAQDDWDRRWLLLLARVPEGDRPVRHLLHTRLGWLGFGRPAPGAWISTHTGRVKEVELLLREAGAYEQAQIFLSEHLGGGDLPSLVRQSWDLAGIERAYQEFIDEFTDPPADDPIVRFTRLVHTWRRLPLIDPVLPAELLPAPWIGERAVRLFHDRHGRWEPTAIHEWERISQEAS
ncbi:PaaX family transcriptional regulator C-terminal domain-containing protein [Solwaraspora sp. WMMD792]|uniref:PaaX family transcriptional regulator n=1 Tax=Solwaraspora sp. WMMD792 TaxID=3016099 RepID=UPI0024170D69|nr:PaaX family transcriptional regulator C-terminal domain-containing protein [Solwaraspora sp. WMMD792]MDG4769773.1 PaaX family transcriptional regulator C-terminal domain-containing protein [Solwaraspora sp. WMMD792]